MEMRRGRNLRNGEGLLRQGEERIWNGEGLCRREEREGFGEWGGVMNIRRGRNLGNGERL